MNIIFMGTPDFAQESLKALYDANYHIMAVVTNPDRPQGRGMKVAESPVKQYAIEQNLTIYQPTKIRHNEEFLNEIKSLQPDLLCVVAYGKILPKELLEIPKLGAINVHGSLLPKYRGAAPIQWAVINGEKTTGITTMYMNEGMDTGDMILQREIAINPDETTGELWKRMSKLGATLLVETVKKIEQGTVSRKKQPEEGTMAPMLSKDMGRIQWDQPAQMIKNLVRGLNPIMGAYSYVGGKKIKIWKVETCSYEEFMDKFQSSIITQNIKNAKCGTVLLSNAKQGLYIQTGNDIISVKEIQGENAKKMEIGAFLLGNSILSGTILK